MSLPTHFLSALASFIERTAAQQNRATAAQSPCNSRAAGRSLVPSFLQSYHPLFHSFLSHFVVSFSVSFSFPVTSLPILAHSLSPSHSRLPLCLLQTTDLLSLIRGNFTSFSFSLISPSYSGLSTCPFLFPLMSYGDMQEDPSSSGTHRHGDDSLARSLLFTMYHSLSFCVWLREWNRENERKGQGVYYSLHALTRSHFISHSSTSLSLCPKRSQTHRSSVVQLLMM